MGVVRANQVGVSGGSVTARSARKADCAPKPMENAMSIYADTQTPSHLAWLVNAVTGYVANRVRACLEYAPADRLSFAPDCGLSQTARWAARQKLRNMVAGVKLARERAGVR